MLIKNQLELDVLGRMNSRARTAILNGFAVMLFLAVAVMIGIGPVVAGASGAATSSVVERGLTDLRIFFVDVEGGQATLFVTPSGQSLLIDTGWDDFNGRDADRIVAAAKKAGLTKIDYVLITHFHEDHVGGAPQLTDRIPVGTFIDHGENRESTDAPTVQVWQAYQKLLATGKYQHITAKPGDTLPIKGFKATVISSDGATIVNPLPGAGQENPACKNDEKYPEDQT
jgi:competence protein ComEC